jgi:hypothetical protein
MIASMALPGKTIYHGRQMNDAKFWRQFKRSKQTEFSELTFQYWRNGFEALIVFQAGTRNHSKSIAAEIFIISMMQQRVNIPLLDCRNSCRKNKHFQSWFHYCNGGPTHNRYDGLIESRTETDPDARMGKLACSLGLASSPIWED